MKKETNDESLNGAIEKRQAGYGDACLLSQYSGGRGRWTFVSSRPAWSTDPVQDSQGYTEKPCLEEQNKTTTTKGITKNGCLWQSYLLLAEYTTVYGEEETQDTEHKLSHLPVKKNLWYPAV